MAKILTLDGMLEVLEIIQHPNASIYAREMENIGNRLAADIRARTGTTSNVASREETALGGTAAAFYPAHAGDPVPGAMKDFDPAGDWEPAMRG